MHFDVRKSDDFSYGVFAVEPKAGNDMALIAVFESPIGAYALANILNHAATAFGGTFSRDGAPL